VRQDLTLERREVAALNTLFLKPVSKGVRRHPRRALMILLFALRHQKRLRAVNRATQRASDSADAARRVASDRRVRKETRAAVTALAVASARARKVGVTKASGDKQLAGHLRRASRHASTAVTMAERASRKPRRMRKTVTLVLWTGAVGGAAYVGWKKYGRPEPPATPPWTPFDVPPASDTPSEAEATNAQVGETTNGGTEDLA
jgi:hypothetical protein